MASPSDFRARAMQLAQGARTVNQDADPSGIQRDAAAIADPARADIVSRSDDAYARRQAGAPISAAAANDLSLRQAANKRHFERQAMTEAVNQRRAGIKAAYGSAASQEAIEEIKRQMELERKRRDAALIGDLLGAAGAVGGFVIGGPAGGVLGAGLGKSAGGAIGGR